MFKKFFINTEAIISKLENSKIPFSYSVLAFFAAITLRNFLEIYSDGTPIRFDIYAHYYFSYIALAMALILLFYFGTSESIKKIARVILPGFIITNIVPILDLIISGGKGYDISYYAPGASQGILLKFLTFFGAYGGQGATPGIRIEVALVMLGGFTYYFVKKRQVVKGAIFAFLIYCLIFTYGVMPFIVKAFINLFGVEYEFTNILLFNFYLLLSFVLGNWLIFLYHPLYYIEIVKDLRFLRILHYVAIFFVGLATVPGITERALKIDQDVLFSLILSVIAFVFACLFSIVINNLADHKIDAVSNRTRPTVTGAIPRPIYRYLGWVFLGLALIYAFLAGFSSWFFIMLFMGNYFLYSAPPFRFKRVPILSKLIIGLNTFIMGLWGFSIAAGSSFEELGQLPLKVMAYYLIFFTLSVNFIDIKDYEGDKRAGIKTLPTLLGLKNSKLLIGFLMFSAYAAVWLFFNFPGLAVYILPVLGLMQFYLVNRKQYKEWPIFLVYFVTLAYIWQYL